MGTRNTGSASRRISRRRALAFGGATALFGSFSIPKTSLGQERMTNELVISTWSGFFANAVRETLVEPFQREFNVRVRVGVTGNAAELMTKIRAGATSGGGDVIDVFWNEYPTAFTATRQ